MLAHSKPCPNGWQVKKGVDYSLEKQSFWSLLETDSWPAAASISQLQPPSPSCPGWEQRFSLSSCLQQAELLRCHSRTHSCPLCCAGTWQRRMGRSHTAQGAGPRLCSFSCLDSAVLKLSPVPIPACSSPSGSAWTGAGPCLQCQ